MLIKTWEPKRHVEIMYAKRAHLRRLARRQSHDHKMAQSFAAVVHAVAEAMNAMTVSNRVLHHAKPHALPLKPGYCQNPSHADRKTHTVTRWNIFGEQLF